MKKDRERADRLARAIDELIQGQKPPDLDDEELNELLQIAKIRLDAAQASANAAAQEERAIWEQITSRLKVKRQDDIPNGLPNGLADTGQEARGPSSSRERTQMDLRELQDVISLRRQAAVEAVAIADSHRDAVWQHVEARIQSGLLARPGFFLNPFRRCYNPRIESFTAAVDRLVLGEPIWEVTDSRLEELVRLARVRQAIGHNAAKNSRLVQGRLWAHLRPRLMAKLLGARVGSPRPATAEQQPPAVTPQPSPSPANYGRVWPKFALAAASVAAFLLAALGPLPTTGLAGHPATKLVQFLGDHVGVSETDAPPTIPPPTQVVQATDMSAQEASDLLGLAVHEPSYLPEGFEQVSSSYFPEPITAPEGGLFTLSYENVSDPVIEQADSGTADAPAILIYQELASDTSIVVQKGFARDVVIPGGIQATYVEGSWRPSGSEIVWGEEGAQALVLEIDGLRTIIQYRGDSKLELAELMVIARSMMTGAVPNNSSNPTIEGGSPGIGGLP